MKISLRLLSNSNFFLIFILGLWFVFCSNLISQAQDEALVWQDKEVKTIDISGNKIASLATLLSKIKTKVGTRYSVAVARDDIKRLYALGYFDDVRVELSGFEGGVKVMFVVVEKPIISSIAIKGARRISQRVLEDSMKTKEGAYLDKQKLRSDLEEIKRIYARKGFLSVEANYDSIQDEAANKTALIINIDEGLSARIKTVLIQGNKTFSNSKIIGLIKSKPAKWWLFRKGYFNDSVLAEDIERLLSFYRKEGFTDVNIERETYKLRSGWFKLILKIQEGKRYYVGEVTFFGNKAFGSGELKKQLKQMLTDHVFSQESLQADEFNIRSLYMDNGYIFAKVTGTTNLNQKTGKVDVNFNIVEDEISYVNLIKVKGNIKTKEVVIRRELRLKPGDRFDGTKLRRSKERLYNLGFFDEVDGIDFDIEPTEDKNKSNLIVQVKETQTGAFSFGGGYSTVDQFVGFVEIEQKNFDWKNFPYFTGAGQDLRVRASIGSISKNLDLSFTEPWMFDYPVSFGFDVYRRQRNRETDVGYGYDEDRLGGDLRLGREFSDYWRSDTFYRIEKIEIGDIENSASADFKKEEGENNLSTWGLSATFDSRDNIFEPHKGLVFYNSFETTGGPFGGDKNFTKLWNSTSYFFPMPKDAVIMFKVQSGLENPFGDSDEVPIYERFFAGGANTIRGYRERKVGPIDTLTDDPIGGEALFVGNLEYQYPIWKYMRVVGFLDSGNVWRRVEDFASGNFKTGVGFGLRVKTPLGPFKLDYGFPLNVEPGEDKKEGRFHFSFSRGF
ncbi:MAG: outer membrane protein assembly factor BamA [Candidatus Omnitrophota bacterium]